MAGKLKLTNGQRFVLKWLSEADASALGECRGKDLTALVEAGLAEVKDAHLGDWAQVSLTDAGRKALEAGRG